MDIACFLAKWRMMIIDRWLLESQVVQAVPIPGGRNDVVDAEIAGLPVQNGAGAMSVSNQRMRITRAPLTMRDGDGPMAYPLHRL